MPDSAECPVDQLYQAHRYPAMSHPLCDPAVTAVAARLGGLATAPPAQARILEIGCASGHNLLPLARRWPQSRWPQKTLPRAGGGCWPTTWPIRWLF